MRTLAQSDKGGTPRVLERARASTSGFTGEHGLYSLVKVLLANSSAPMNPPQAKCLALRSSPRHCSFISSLWNCATQGLAAS
jgi:hypothetical protein